MCTQTRPRFGGNGVRAHVTPKEKSPLPEAQRRIKPMTASRRTASPTHYRLSYSGPDKVNDADETFVRVMAVMMNLKGSEVKMMQTMHYLTAHKPVSRTMKFKGSRGENDTDHALFDGPQTCVQDWDILSPSKP